MPRITNKLPSYRLHKSDGRAVVTLNGHDVYLGKYGTTESRAEYDRVIAEWLATGRGRPPVSATSTPDDPTVSEVILAFWGHAQEHYRRRDGSATGEIDNYRDALRPLRRLYGSSLAADFGPLKLKAARQSMIDAGLARTTINRRIGRIVSVFKWAASEELIPVSVYQSLRTVSGLSKGRSAARESAPVRPVPAADVDAIRPFVARQVWAMIELQMFTGMRPGEVTAMRTGDIDRSGDVWVYTPSSHEMSYRDQDRRIFLGPKAQGVLRPWLKADPGLFLFRACDARTERHAAMRARRKSKVQPSQVDRSRPGAKRRPGLRYSVRGYNRAVRKACAKANVPP
jgi:integrase